MELKELKCKNCKAVMMHDEANARFYCPHCGYEQFYIQSDDVIKEKIRNNTQKEIELEKLNVEKEKIHNEFDKRSVTSRYILLACIGLSIILLFAGIGTIYNKISHIGHIMVPQPAVSFQNKDYEEVKNIFIELGFDETNIDTFENATLDMSQADSKRLSYQVSINGNTSFTNKSYFPKDSKITIYYYEIDPKHVDDICIGYNCVNSVGLNYEEVRNIFSAAGFKNENIELKSIKDLSHEDQSLAARVTEVTVNGISIINLKEDSWVSGDSKLAITYHDFDPDKIKDIKIPYNYNEYVGRNYLDVYKELCNIGFTNVLIEPLGDVKKDKDAGIIEKVIINKREIYAANDIVKQYDEIIIQYHSKEFVYVDKDRDEIIKLLTDAGFRKETIHLNPLTDLQVDQLKSSNGKVSEITIGSLNGRSLSEKGTISLNEPVFISYHSPIVEDNNHIKMIHSEKELKKMTVFDAETNLKNLGYTNITLVPLNDVYSGIIGWGQSIFFSAGDVESVTIDGNEIEINYIYPKNVKIVIKYHSEK